MKNNPEDKFHAHFLELGSECAFLNPVRTTVRLSTGVTDAIRFSPAGVAVSWLYILHNEQWYSVLEDGVSEIQPLGITEWSSHEIAYPIYISGRLAAAGISEGNKKARAQAEETLSKCIQVFDDYAHPVRASFKLFTAGEYASFHRIEKSVAAAYLAELEGLQYS